jgi:hypothetical protein
MSEELMKQQQQNIDGFAGYEDSVEGETEQTRGVIQGSIIKFNDSTWVARGGAELPPNLELVAVDVGRVVQKWIDKQPVETRILEPGQKFPDIKELNEKTPKSEWGKDQNDQSCGPWQAQHIVYLLNPKTMDKYSFPTDTIGGSIAVRDLVDKTLWMRRYRRVHVYPVVVLSDVFMNTRFGGRQRPHFIIKRWIILDGSQQALPATLSLPPTTVKDALDTFAANPPVTAAAAAPTQPKTVNEPSVAEEMDDAIPF